MNHRFNIRYYGLLFIFVEYLYTYVPICLFISETLFVLPVKTLHDFQNIHPLHQLILIFYHPKLIVLDVI
jgi:hypothetical protein